MLCIGMHLIDFDTIKKRNSFQFHETQNQLDSYWYSKRLNLHLSCRMVDWWQRQNDLCFSFNARPIFFDGDIGGYIIYYHWPWLLNWMSLAVLKNNSEDLPYTNANISFNAFNNSRVIFNSILRKV